MNKQEVLILGVADDKFGTNQYVYDVSASVLIESMLGICKNFAPDSINDYFEIISVCIQEKEATTVSLSNQEVRALFDVLSIVMISNLSLLRYNMYDPNNDFSVVDAGYGDYDIQLAEDDDLPHVKARISALHELHLQNRLLNIVLQAIAEKSELVISYSPTVI